MRRGKKMKIKKVLLFLLVFAMMLSTSILNASPTNATAESVTTTQTPSQQYAASMEPGWNLGNTFDGFDTGGDRGEQSWGNPLVTKDLIKEIRKQGFNSIRMPFTSVMRTGDAPSYTIDPTFLARYAEVVQWALDEGLYVMINIHHDSWYWAGNIGSDDGTLMKKYIAIWTQLANYFKDYSDKVSFESINEPQFWTGSTANQIKILEGVNTQFYHIVRNSGGNNVTRMLILPTLNTNDSTDRCLSLYNTIKGFNDDNIIAAFHYYGFWPFSTNIAGTTTMDATVIRELEAAFDRVYNQFFTNGIGVICGEYGLLGFDKSLGAIEHGEVLKYFEYINYYAQQKDITMMLWDNGQHMGRTSLTWSDQSLYNIIKASWTSRSSYTESDRIFITDNDIAEDVSIKLTLNSNTLKSISNGHIKLKKDKDYTYMNNTLTLNADYVKSVISHDYGINATLTMSFSDGADWTVYLTHYTTPVLGSGIGSTAGFIIPVEFNGSRLSTLEAMKPDGTGTGPQSWTTYKEFDYAFSVDYDANTVTMKDKFFAEAADGIIILKLHFQSGEILECMIEKSGTTVTAVTQ
jgi:aryl-phospho-beta-D-glucosidase BglC (GH1 family)